MQNKMNYKKNRNLALAAQTNFFHPVYEKAEKSEMSVKARPYFLLDGV